MCRSEERKKIEISEKLPSIKDGDDRIVHFSCTFVWYNSGRSADQSMSSELIYTFNDSFLKEI